MNSTESVLAQQKPAAALASLAATEQYGAGRGRGGDRSKERDREREHSRTQPTTAPRILALRVRRLALSAHLCVKCTTQLLLPGGPATLQGGWSPISANARARGPRGWRGTWARVT